MLALRFRRLANDAIGRGPIHSIGFLVHPNRIRKRRWFHHNIMTLSNIAATAGKRAARYGYRNHRPIVPRHNELNGIHSNPKMNGERMVIGTRGVPPISICVKGPFAIV